MKRIWMLAAVLVLTALTLSGCWTRTIDEMYAIPRRSSEYKNLQSVIDAAMVGMEYAAPIAGENQQTIQMADLTGNGRDEIIVYTKNASDKLLYILVFQEDEQGNFSLKERIECNGTNFEQVEYVDVDGRPGLEIVVGRRLNGQIMAICSVYSFDSGSADQIVSTIYSKFLTVDMDGDGCNDLFVIRKGEGERSNAYVVLYSYKSGALERSREAELSGTVEQIRRIMATKLYSGEPAVFVASAQGEDAILTDVFAIKNGSFTNISYSAESGHSVQTLRNYYLYSEDIDNDGQLELPSLVTMKSVSASPKQEQQYMIRWYSLDIDGNEYSKATTFHNYSAGWYIQLDSAWGNRVTMEQDGNNCTFYIWDEDYTEAMPLFAIHTLTGKERDEQATVMNRFALYRGENVVFSGSLGVAAPLYGFTEENLYQSFHLIYQAWKTGET